MNETSRYSPEFRQRAVHLFQALRPGHGLVPLFGWLAFAFLTDAVFSISSRRHFDTVFAVGAIRRFRGHTMVSNHKVRIVYFQFLHLLLGKQMLLHHSQLLETAHQRLTPRKLPAPLASAQNSKRLAPACLLPHQ